MNLFLLWPPHLHEDDLGIFFLLYYIFIFALVFSSYWMKDLWMKRFVRYYTPLSLIFLNKYIHYFIFIEHGKLRISEYHIIIGPPIIYSKLRVFFIGVETSGLFIAVVSLLFFSLFKIFGIVLRKFRSRVNQAERG